SPRAQSGTVAIGQYRLPRLGRLRQPSSDSDIATPQRARSLSLRIEPWAANCSHCTTTFVAPIEVFMYAISQSKLGTNDRVSTRGVRTTISRSCGRLPYRIR